MKTVNTNLLLRFGPVEEPCSALIFLANLILPFFVVQALSFVPKLSFLLVPLAGLRGSPSGGLCSPCLAGLGEPMALLLP